MDVKRKKLLNSGQEHFSRDDKKKKAKEMGPPCPLSCRLKCSGKVNEEERKLLFNLYWALGDHTRQWDFISKNVKMFLKKQSINQSESRRNFSRTYNFTINNQDIQVCQKMFLQTLAISDKIITNVCTKVKESPTIPSDQRGKHRNRPHAIKDNVKKQIMEHIERFPIVDSHYTREYSKKKFLDSNLSISKMHRLFLESVENNPSVTDSRVLNVTLRQYSDIFNNEYNYAFFKPKKDMCDICEQYRLSTPEQKNNLQIEYDEHISNKILARERKNADKKRAENDSEFCIAVFDLEKVLQTPQSEVSSFYYKRKIATYNFTIYDIGKKDGYLLLYVG